MGYNCLDVRTLTSAKIKEGEKITITIVFYIVTSNPSLDNNKNYAQR